MKLSANLNFLFTEGGKHISERIYMAHKAGFKAVEIPFPNIGLEDILLAKEETGIDVALINISIGDSKFGCASIPDSQENFKNQLNETIHFAKKVQCKKIHIMAGLTEGESSEHLVTYKNNLKYSADILEMEDMIGLIEPINKYALPSYFLNSFETASSIIREISSKHIRLLVDLYHLQHIMGNITQAFTDFKDIIGHFQIAQVPHRHEPDVAGELDFNYIFDLIKLTGYNGWIGCEYKPKSNTLEGLKWMQKYNIQL
ncbi:putative hydroxypyruvate isomerase [Zeugodacus cucurbitae]|uniref:Putative hydroxypyruvate isomerase n=1 Tax=Zeugodacus cucurbitae TaxID=28588 RepID=A0A0A1XFE5_ZEUCU|nr:putative hydroxypyruvate isomerase [Zeugodacus cucurbitae]